MTGDAAAPVVTALVIVRDREDTIRPAVQSLLAQTFADLEVLVIDDGSSDKTPSVVRELQLTDPRVRLEHNLGDPGIPGARNWGLHLARGEFLAICDSDDLSRPERFASQVEYLRGHPAAGAVGSQISCFTEDPAAGTEPDWRWGLTDGRGPFAFPTGMFRTRVVLEVGGFDDSFPVVEDLEMCYRVAAAGWSFGRLDQALVDYRVGTGGASTRSDQLWLMTLRAQIRGLRALRGRFTPAGYAAIGQSLWRTTRERLASTRRHWCSPRSGQRPRCRLPCPPPATLEALNPPT